MRPQVQSMRLEVSLITVRMFITENSFELDFKSPYCQVFSCVCPVIDHEFRLNIVKVVCRSTRLSHCGSTDPLTML